MKTKKWENAFWNEDFYSIKTYSGLGLIGSDPSGAQHLLAAEATDDKLGAALLDALSKSRELTLDEYGEFFNYEKREIEYGKWVALMKEKYAYKTKKALFRVMRSCAVTLDGEMLEIDPSRHEQLEAWSGTGIKESDKVIIPSNSSEAEIGAALRLAFSRCR